MEFFDGTEVLEVSDPPSVVRKRARVERLELVARFRMPLVARGPGDPPREIDLFLEQWRRDLRVAG